MQTDQLELQRAMKGDERAMRQLWLRHSPHIDAVVRRLCDDQDIAADIAQEVWIQIFRALPGYRGESQFGTWAHRIAVNRTLNALRKVKRLARIETEIEGAHERWDEQYQLQRQDWLANQAVKRQGATESDTADA